MFLLGRILFCSLIFFQSFLGASGTAIIQQKPLKLVLIDSANHDIEKYASVIALATSVGYSVAYLSIADLLDIQKNYQELLSADALFFVFSIEFLKGMHSSPVAQTILSLLERFCAEQQKLIGLFFPSLGATVLHHDALLPLWSRLRLDPLDVKVDSFLKAAMCCINNGVESRAVPYHTMLNGPRIGRSVGILQSDLHKKNNSFAALPICKDLYPGAKNDFPSVIKSLLPFGVFYPNKNNSIVVSSAGLLSFLGVCENFHIAPVAMSIRYQLYTALQRFFWEIKALFEAQKKIPLVFNEGICPRLIKAKKITQLPQRLVSIMPIKTQGKRMGAWMELIPFESAKEGADLKEWQRLQEELINYILTAKLNYIWVSFLPNMYYSPVARHGAKKTEFLKTVGRFTQLLKKMAGIKKVKVPDIYVGFEIVNNLLEQHVWKNQAQDIYGNQFFDVPSPLDSTFWDQEVVQPFISFVRDFKCNEVGHGLPLAGIVLDLEMYGRKTTGEFLSTMLGDEKQDAVSIARNGYKNYFKQLQQQAQVLGRKLKTEFLQVLPRLRMVIYAPNINLDWFYQGLYQGMSSKQDPLLLLTFNALYHPYQKSLENRSIFAEHSSVLMLSKIQTPLDFNWISMLGKYQQGLWLNRWSRMVESYDKLAWFGLEQTPLNSSQKFEFCCSLAAAQQNKK